MIRVIIIVAFITITAFLIIGSADSGKGKDNYAKPLGKVTEHIVKDVSKGADITYKEATKKAKEISKDIKENTN